VKTTRRQRWLGGGAVLSALALGSLTLTAHAADPAPPPTLAQAQAAYSAAASAHQVEGDQLATVKAYLDAQGPTTPPADPAKPTAFTAVRSSDCLSVTLTWGDPTGGAPANYDYQRDGVDNTGFGAYVSDPLPATTHTAVLDKLVPANPYNVAVNALDATGTVTGTASAAVPACTTSTSTATASPTASVTPTATATATATATSTATAGGRPSGLPWSSGVWADQDPSQTAAFVSGPRGGANVDNILVYATRDSVAAENNPTEWRQGLPSGFNPVTQDLVLALTTWTGDGAFMTQAQGAQIGTALCSVDPSSPIVRLDWEMNLQDGAGSNGAELTSSNRTAWQTRFIAVATGIKSTCAGALIDFNPNHGGDQTPGCSGTTCTRAAFQAVKSVVNIYGIDSYDSFPPVKADNSGWNNRLTGSNEMQDALNYAVANGKKFSVPEWGLFCSGTSGCAINNGTDGGNDDPNYAHQMIGFFKANAANIAYETYFNETATYINDDLISHNPNTRTQYRSDLLAART
jgi:hypothetical protein